MTVTTRLHEEHKEWMEELTLWHNELMFYERIVVRMEAQKNLVPQWNDRLEEFMSKFQTMLKEFDFMREGIEMHERIINASDHDDDNVTTAHDSAGRKMRNFKREFNLLKNEFFFFSDKLDY